MRDVRNIDNKLVCKIDDKNHLIEILTKGCKTTIHFDKDGNVKITNSKMAA